MEKNQDFAIRFVEFLKWSEKDIGDLCQLIDQDENARAKWYRYRSGAAIPSGNTLIELKRHFPKLNINWLLTGDGTVSVDDLSNIAEVESLRRENTEQKSKIQMLEGIVLRAMGKAKGVTFSPKSVNLFRRLNPMYEAMQKGLKIAV